MKEKPRTAQMLREALIRKRGGDQIGMRDGKWYMRTDPRSDGAQIPDDVARVVRMALWLQSRHDSNDQRHDASGDVVLSVNCHKTAFHALGLIDRREAIEGESSLEAFLMPRDAFIPFDDVDTLKSHLASRLGTKLGLVQICDYYDKPDHSFLVAFDEKGEPVCFEKEEYGGRFRVVPLAEIFAVYPRRKWAADVLENLDSPSDKIAARKSLDEARTEIIDI